MYEKHSRTNVYYVRILYDTCFIQKGMTMLKIVANTADLIGDTPLVRLNRLQPENAAQVYLKLEFFQSERQCERQSRLSNDHRS